MRTPHILAWSLAACAVLYWIEQVLAVDYLTKTIAKLVLFAVVPYIYMRRSGQSLSPSRPNHSWSPTRPSFSLGLALGALSFVVIIAAYLVLGRYVDFNSIVQELQTKSKITPANFLLVGLYITFGNSFLEEFFFRGFVFLSLFRNGQRTLAYLYSSILFGIYHIAIFKTWFSAPLIALALFALISVGIIFDWLDTKTDSFVNSWIVHILADSAIILIGMRIFGMI